MLSVFFLQISLVVHLHIMVHSNADLFGFIVLHHVIWVEVWIYTQHGMDRVLFDRVYPGYLCGAAIKSLPILCLKKYGFNISSTHQLIAI